MLKKGHNPVADEIFFFFKQYLIDFLFFLLTFMLVFCLLIPISREKELED